MISRTVQRIRRAIWTWRQPLTNKPTDRNSSVSDLFVWRSSEEWQTFFELIDIGSLFEENQSPRYVTLVIFNDNGILINEKKIILSPNKRQILDVSAAIGRSHGEVGTFAVFHSATPSIMTRKWKVHARSTGAFITDIVVFEIEIERISPRASAPVMRSSSSAPPVKPRNPLAMSSNKPIS